MSFKFGLCLHMLLLYLRFYHTCAHPRRRFFQLTYLLLLNYCWLKCLLFKILCACLCTWIAITWMIRSGRHIRLPFPLLFLVNKRRSIISKSLPPPFECVSIIILLWTRLWFDMIPQCHVSIILHWNSVWYVFFCQTVVMCFSDKGMICYFGLYR